MYNNQEIALKIKQTAKDKKVPIKQLLENCNLNVNYISQFANGRDMTAGNLYSIANYLGVSIDYLLGRTDESKTETSDPTTQILVEHFNNLSSDDKITVLNMVLEKSKKQ